MWPNFVLLWEDCWFFRVNVAVGVVLLLVILIK